MRPQKASKTEAPSNLSFDREYRPSSLQEYLGNKIAVESTLARLKANKLPQVILFVGPAGTGKTSFARLLTRELRCKSKVNGLACGVCDTCVRTTELFIKQAKDIEDIREFNMTANGGKDAADDINEYATQRPRDNKYKILILDEIHGASPAAQNAILKLLEEPKEYLYIFGCTTDPERIIDTLKSRFAYEVSIMPPDADDISQLLKRICREKSINYSEEGIKLIIKKCKRVPRRCIKGLEAVSSIGDVTVDNVIRVMDTLSYDVWVHMFELINKKDYAGILTYINVLDDEQIGPEKLLKHLPEFVEAVLEVSNGVNLQFYATDFIKSVRKVVKMNDLELLFLQECMTSLNANYPPKFNLMQLSGKLMYKDNFISKIINAGQELAQENKKSQDAFEKNERDHLNAHAEEQELGFDDILEALNPIGGLDNEAVVPH